MREPYWRACRYGSSTTTAFTRTRRSVIVHPVSSSPHVNPDDLSDLSGATTLVKAGINLPYTFSAGIAASGPGDDLNPEAGGPRPVWRQAGGAEPHQDREHGRIMSPRRRSENGTGWATAELQLSSLKRSFHGTLYSSCPRRLHLPHSRLLRPPLRPSLLAGERQTAGTRYRASCLPRVYPSLSCVQP
jgi:hypothetical protein